MPGAAQVWFRPEDHQAVGECLAQLRRMRGLTQQSLAAFLGKPQSFVSSYEQGQRRIDLLEFLHIIDTLEGDPSVVFADILARRQAGK